MRKFVDDDPKAIEREILEEYEKEYDEVLYPGDESRLFLQGLLPFLSGTMSQMNYWIAQNLLPYAEGENLDYLGVYLFRTKRLEPQRAISKCEIELSATQPDDYTYPAGERITGDEIHYFITTEDIVVPAGNLTAQGSIQAVNTGPEYNEFAIGQIVKMTNPLPFVKSIKNIESTSGGSDAEKDEPYRERCRLAQETYSNAGHSDSYKYFARSADSTIVDVGVESKSPGTVNVIVLQENGEIPTDSIIQRVFDRLSPKDVRPLTDNVVVEAPEIVEYDVDFTYYISSENSAKQNSIRESIEGAGGVVESYVAWQHEKLDRHINPDKLRSDMYAAGTIRMDLLSPTYTEITGNKVARLRNINVIYGGLTQ